ncbi:MAG: Uma2 family endonuclease [Acidobacteriaceae bacterium]
MAFALSNLELPVRLRFERPMTDEELMRFCAENELLRVEREANGELIVMSPSGSEGGGIETDVATELNIWARCDGRGKVFGSNAGFHLPDGSVRAADAHWVSWARWNALTEAERKGFAPLCPEFVIEVRSESDRLAELQAKMGMWLANGAELAWLVDPSRKAVEVYRPGREAEVLEGGSAVEGDGPVAGFVLELGRIWG